LAAGLAHEIRNPISAISGSTKLLGDSPALSAEDRQLCGIIQQEARRLNDLVTDMINLTRPRPPTFTAIDVAAVAREVIRLARESGRGAGDVGIRFEGADHVLVRADGSQIRQLIWNLVRNAVQASGPGDEVLVRVVDDPGAKPWLEIADNGVGIDEAAQERVFDAFFTTRSQGTGIGLAVVRRIVDDHGYTIDLKSAAGQGATFRVNLLRWEGEG
jgi:signal transduction histidine kinase